MQLRHPNAQTIWTLFYTTRSNRTSTCHLPLLYIDNSNNISIVFEIVFINTCVSHVHIYLLFINLRRMWWWCTNLFCSTDQTKKSKKSIHDRVTHSPNHAPYKCHTYFSFTCMTGLEDWTKSLVYKTFLLAALFRCPVAVLWIAGCVRLVKFY
jgi:hypothetical protein